MFGSTRRPILATLVLGLALPFAAILSPTTATTAAAAELCTTAQSGGAGDDYDGPSASYRYDRIFSRSFGMQHRFTHTQQGIATWHNWRGGKADIFLLTSYDDGGDSYVTAYRASNGSYLNTIRIGAGHVGGIAVSGHWAFISGKFTADGSHTIRKYRLSDFRRALLSDGPYEYVTQVGAAREVYGASFLSASAGYLYAGRHDTNSTNWMYRYKINSNGSLTPGARFEVPMKTQGLVVTGSHFIYSTSWKRENRSNIWVVRRGHELLADSSFSCFRAPSMSQGVTAYGNRVYLTFESGSVPYVRDEDTLNKIGYVHRAPIGKLTRLA